MALRASTSAVLVAARPLLSTTVVPLCCNAAIRQVRQYAARGRPKGSSNKTPIKDLSSEVPTELDLHQPSVPIPSDMVPGKPSVTRLRNEPIAPTLRPYQDECIEAVMDYLERGDKRLGVSLATGSGKTVIFTNLISRVPAPSPERKQTMILVHRQELAEQAYNMVKRTHPELTVELEMGSEHRASGVADVTISMVQSLVASDGKRLEKFDADKHKLILLDECHHAVSKSWLKVLQHMKIWDADGPVTLGFSATMHRADGMGLGKVLQRIVYHKDFMDMAKDKWLSDSIFTTVRTMIDLNYVPVVGGGTGDFQVAELSKAVNTVASNDIIVKAWQTKCIGRKSTLVFAVDVAHVIDLTHAFRFSGIDARAVTGQTPLAERKELVRGFKAGEFPVLVNCGLFTEGTDIPNIDCVVLARPTRSKALLTQMIGRGMRLHPDKINCHILDITCAIKNGVLTAPTLFGLDPDELLDSTSGSTLSKRATEIDLSPPPPPPIPGLTDPLAMEFTDYTNIMDLLEDTRPDTHVRSLSKFAWVQCSPHKWILQCGAHGFIRVERNPQSNTFSAHVVRGLLFPDNDLRMAYGGRRLMAPHELFSDIELFENAIHGADTYAASHFPRNLILTSATWRKAQPSATQFQMLSKILGKEITQQNNVNNRWTKGKVADMITKMKYGAKSVWASAQKDMWRAAEAAEKRRKREAASTIKVGELLDVAEKLDSSRSLQGKDETYKPVNMQDGFFKHLIERKGEGALKPFIGRKISRKPDNGMREKILMGQLGPLEEPERLDLKDLQEDVSMEEQVRRDLEREQVLEQLLVRKVEGLEKRRRAT